MSKINFTITKKNDEKKTLYQQIKKSGLKIKGSCKKGACKKCLIKVSGKVNKPSDQEIKILGEEKIKKGYRLACLTYSKGDTNVSLPQEK